MNRKKFEYFLNAVYYCIWLNQRSFQDFVQKIVFTMLSPIPKYFFPAKWREKFYERQAIGLEQWNDYRNNSKVGWNIGMANGNFGLFCALYPFSIVFILIGISLRFSIYVNSLTVILVVTGLMALFYIPVNKLVYSKDRYLKYFKKFRNEDKQWLKKWNRVTAAFCFGGILIFLGSFAIAWLILLW